MTKRIMPDIISEPRIFSLTPQDTVMTATQMMADKHIGAILVLDGEKLVGIFTERDIAVKAVAGRKSITDTRLADVMTPNPDSIRPDEYVFRALELMQAGGFRHLPIVGDEGVIGLISIRDVYGAVREDLEEALLEREAFISGTGYGGVD